MAISKWSNWWDNGGKKTCYTLHPLGRNNSATSRELQHLLIFRFLENPSNNTFMKQQKKFFSSSAPEQENFGPPLLSHLGSLEAVSFRPDRTGLYCVWFETHPPSTSAVYMRCAGTELAGFTRRTAVALNAHIISKFLCCFFSKRKFWFRQSSSSPG